MNAESEYRPRCHRVALTLDRVGSWNVDVKAWNEREALAIVAGVRVRVDKNRYRARWRCDACGPQINAPTCPHATAFAATPIPKKEKST